MKKEFGKKLFLNKKAVTNLNDNDMDLVRGGTLVHICSESCSIVKMCCTPTEENYMEQPQDQGLG